MYDQMPNRRLQVIYLQHFLGVGAATAIIDGTLRANVSGTAAALADDTGDQNSIGVSKLLTGTDTTGRAGVSSSATMFRFGGGKAAIEIRATLSAVVDGTDTYKARWGFLDDVTTEPTDGIFFRYSFSTTPKLECVARANGTETAVDISAKFIPVAGTFNNYRIEVAPDGLRCRFFVDDQERAAITSNIPIAAGRETGFGASIIKSAGTTTRSLNLDRLFAAIGTDSQP